MFVLMCVIWGLPYLLIKVAVRDVTPAELVWMRTSIGALVLVPIAAVRGDLRAALPRWRPVLAFAAVEIAVPWWFLSSAELRLPSSLSGLLVATVPLIALPVGYMTGNHVRPTPQRLAGLAVGLVGVVALLGFDVHGGQVLSSLEVLLVAVCYASGPMIVSRWLADTPSLGVLAWSMLAAAVVYTPIGLVDLPGRMSASAIGAVAMLGLVCTALAFVIFLPLIAEIGPQRATVITYVNPAVAIAGGALLLHEHITATTMLGFGLVIAGSVLATSAPAATG